MSIIKIRRDKNENWESSKSITPAVGEFCYATDTNKLKIGDGEHKFKDIPTHFVNSDETNKYFVKNKNKLRSIHDLKRNMDVLDDEEYSNILETQKRSTFDRSKFTVAGTPTITDDGIASGFSGSKYLTFPMPELSTASNWKFSFLFTPSSYGTSAQYLFLVSASTPPINFFKATIESDGKFWFTVHTSESGAAEYRLFTYRTTDTVILNALNAVEIEYIETEGYFVNLNGVRTKASSVTTKIGATNGKKCFIGPALSAVRSLDGSFDLKQFSITVDGVEVFNGNKTGIDQIKKDYYTNSKFTPLYAYTYGTNIIYSNSSTTPTYLYNSNGMFYTGTDFTINSTGETPVVMYGENVCTYDSTKTIRQQLDIDETGVVQRTKNDRGSISFIEQSVGTKFSDIDTWEFEGVYTFLDYNNVGYIFNIGPNVISCYVTTGGTYRIRLNGVYDFYQFQLYMSETYKPVKVNLKFTGTQYILTVTDYDSGILLGQLVKDNTNKVTSSYNNLNLTFPQWSTYSGYANVKMDLNTFKFYGNGQLVYQPTLRIPYTQSKTGNKIVDSVYRDRVQDMYEQFGYTHYYTLGDEPEKYNVSVVGSPTLSGGIASGFSSGNFLKCNQVIKNNTSTWRCICKFHTPTTATTSQNMFLNFGAKSITNTSTKLVPSLSMNTYNRLTVNMGGASDNYWIWGSNGKVVNIDTDYWVDFGYNGTQVYCKISTDGVTYSNFVTPTNSQTNGFFETFEDIFIGSTNIGFANNTDLSIDLSQFSITVDGKEIFRGYEPAIPNAFTLPTHKPTDIVDYGYDSETGLSYKQRADLTLTQYGQCTSGETVNLLGYKDENSYSVSIPYSGTKSKNSFVADETGGFMAIGKTYL